MCVIFSPAWRQVIAQSSQSQFLSRGQYQLTNMMLQLEY